MNRLVYVTLVVDEYDRAIDWFREKLGFELVEDRFQPEQGKRWVVISPRGSDGTSLVLGRASNDEQRASIGKAAGGRVAYFLGTDNFERDYHAFAEKGVKFIEQPRREPYGTVVKFEDLYGNKWDLYQPAQK